MCAKMHQLYLLLGWGGGIVHISYCQYLFLLNLGPVTNAGGSWKRTVAYIHITHVFTLLMLIHDTRR